MSIIREVTLSEVGFFTSLLIGIVIIILIMIYFKLDDIKNILQNGE